MLHLKITTTTTTTTLQNKIMVINFKKKKKKSVPEFGQFDPALTPVIEPIPSWTA